MSIKVKCLCVKAREGGGHSLGWLLQEIVGSIRKTRNSFVLIVYEIGTNSQ